ncbi:hypothetical protein ACFWBX_28655 [Streptomyces sp. NPDC059991]|uniref:hypothetical protein n=1 Tax=Streptomyces sp. NPDC059991 TaxID=3347028 RepID=UPI00369C193E
MPLPAPGRAYLADGYSRRRSGRDALVCARMPRRRRHRLGAGSAVAEAHWQVPDVECLRPGTWLGVPRVDLTARPGPYWALPPAAVGCVCAARAVAEPVALGQTRLRQMPSPERTP